MIVDPDPALAPVIPPTIVPIVQLNVLAALAVNEIFGFVLLQIVEVLALVTTGVGFTVTVMVYGDPPQVPVTEVGVMMYSTLPATLLLGLAKV